MKNTINTFVILLISFSCLGQNEDGNWKLFPNKQQTTEIKDTTIIPLEKNKHRVGYVEIVQEQRIKNLATKYDKINEDKNSIPGFRIQLFSGSGANVKAEADEFRSNFLKTHEDIPVYTIWDNPIWKTRVGDFRTKLEAEKFLREIQGDFPNSFIIQDQINFPELK